MLYSIRLYPASWKSVHFFLTVTKPGRNRINHVYDGKKIHGRSNEEAGKAQTIQRKEKSRKGGVSKNAGAIKNSSSIWPLYTT